jgi:alpha-L-rhamnosidase
MYYADKKFEAPEGDSTPAGFIRSSSQRNFDTPNGRVSYQTFNQADEYISAGEAGAFCSRFNYHGFRYVIIEGLPAPPDLRDAEALLVESDLETDGSFECSNDLFNRIHQTNLWTLRCLNLGGYMVDCPHRERLGYGDGQVGIESLVMNRNAAAFYGKWAIDWLDAQNQATGEMTHTAPFSGGGGGPGWGGAGCVLPWKLFTYYGDTRLLEQAYEPMRRYVDFLEAKCTDGVLRHYGGEWDFIGDWVAVGRGMDTNNWPQKPAAELFNNCYRLYLWEQLAKTADALGKTEEAGRCRLKISEIKPLIHTAYYDGQQKLYVLNEQAYQLMPLMTGLVPDDLVKPVMQKLEDCILLKNQGHLDTGMLGTYFLIQYLMETGRNDLLYTMFNQETYPGWGYMLSQGATTLWEQWNGFWSQIHSCFTSPGGWFYQGLAGIRADASAPGFKSFLIKPAIAGDLAWVKCSYNSVHGRIVSNWERTGSNLVMEVTVPANTTATLFVPAAGESSVTESGKPASGAKGVRFLRMEERAAVYTLESGTYTFRSVLQLP